MSNSTTPTPLEAAGIDHMESVACLCLNPDPGVWQPASEDWEGDEGSPQRVLGLIMAYRQQARELDALRAQSVKVARLSSRLSLYGSADAYREQMAILEDMATDPEFLAHMAQKEKTDAQPE